jgi:hypothetical protein
MKNQSLVGSVTAASRFEDTRKLLGDRLSTAVRDILQSNDERLEKERLFRSLRQTAFISASLQTGALGSAMAVATQLLEPVPGLAVLSSLVLGRGAPVMSLGCPEVAPATNSCGLIEPTGWSAHWTPLVPRDRNK